MSKKLISHQLASILDYKLPELIAYLCFFFAMMAMFYFNFGVLELMAYSAIGFFYLLHKQVKARQRMERLEAQVRELTVLTRLNQDKS